jgi:uncharacterized protein
MGAGGPGGIRRRDVLKALAAAGIGAATGAGAHGYLYQRHRIGVSRETLPVSGLSEPLRGLRVAFLTDFHRSQTVSHELLDKAVRLTMAEQPDLIILGGDYVTWGDRHYMPAALAAEGVEMLRDARTQITVRGEPLDLVGIRYWTRKPSDIARLLRGASPNTILLAHTPSRLLEAVGLSVPLVLSGHTHGGQIVVPGLGAIAARKFPVIAGSARRDKTTIFVSRGVGTVYLPIRFNCPPEVAILTLAPA